MRGSDAMRLSFTKAEILEKVTANRKKHAATYAAAMTAFTAIMINRHESEIMRIRQSGVADAERYCSHAQPETHLRDYDEVIAMLEATTDESITLTSGQFSQLMLLAHLIPGESR